MAVTKPELMPVPFANAGLKNTIPVTPPGGSAINQASYDAGFPPTTMTPIVSGGKPPRGRDMNGILYEITAHLTYLNAGGQYWFDADFASKIGGYPLGAVLQSNDGKSSYVSIVDNNTTDFNSDPSSIGTSWLPWAGEGASSGSGILFGGTAGGTSEIITAAFEGLTELTDGLLVSFRATAANTSTNPSFNASSLGALTIVKGADLPLAAGDIGGEGYLVLLQYSTTWNKWVLQNPATGINIVIPSAMPVGAIYVQFAGQTDPTTLFGGTWENVSAAYAGLFFRAEGGNAAAFGLSQGGGAPNIMGFMGIAQMSNWSSNGAFYIGGDDGNQYNWNEFRASGAGQRGISVFFSAANSNGTYSANEFRSANSTIRIWKRTA